MPLMEWAETSRRARKILVVDDDELVRNALSRYLTVEGYDVETAADGEAGLKRLHDDPPSLVLLDLNMPKMGGLEFLKAEKTGRVGVPVILVTAVEDEALAKSAMRLGAADYILKPIDFGYLSTAIRAILAATAPTAGD
jgi:DNA-binding response OmpR family regulator